jgi:hypothetical protein
MRHCSVPTMCPGCWTLSYFFAVRIFFVFSAAFSASTLVLAVCRLVVEIPAVEANVWNQRREDTGNAISWLQCWQVVNYIFISGASVKQQNLRANYVDLKLQLHDTNQIIIVYSVVPNSNLLQLGNVLPLYMWKLTSQLRTSSAKNVQTVDVFPLGDLFFSTINRRWWASNLKLP